MMTDQEFWDAAALAALQGLINRDGVGITEAAAGAANALLKRRREKATELEAERQKASDDALAKLGAGRPM